MGTYDAAVRTVLQQPESDTSILPAAPLSHGARGPAVAQLQDALIAAGLMNADHPYIRMGKGMFGPYTAQIVATLQRDVLDVTPTGVYDNAVRSYLLALPSATPEAPSAATAAVPPTPLARGARGPAVAKLQDILIQLGHLHPSAVRFAKGIYGPRTTAAIAALQKTRGDRTATGVYDEALRTQLQQALSDHQTTTRTPSQQERHWGVYCDKTNQPIVGHRYKMKGQNYDLCEAEFLKLNPAQQAGFECITKSQHRAPSFFGGAFPFVRFMQCPTPQASHGENEPAAAKPAAPQPAQPAQPEQVPSATSAEFPSPPLFVDTARLPQESPAVSQHTVTDPAFLAFSESRAGSVEAAQATPAVNEVTADQRVALLTSGLQRRGSGRCPRGHQWLPGAG